MTPTNETNLPNQALARPGELAGKSAVVTGATEGIGFPGRAQAIGTDLRMAAATTGGHK